MTSTTFLLSCHVTVKNNPVKKSCGCLHQPYKYGMLLFLKLTAKYCKYVMQLQ